VADQPPQPPDFFLPGDRDGSDDEFVSPRREGVRVTPLIGGQETFEALANAVRQAKRYVYLASWTFEPRLRLGTDKQTWNEILKDVAERANVRILVSDIDPLGNSLRHRLAWDAYRTLIDSAGQVSAKLDKQKNAAARYPIEVIISLHEAVIDTGLPGAIAATLTKEFHAVIKKNSSARLLKNMPLLWPHFSLESQKPEPRLAPSVAIHIATHHQKLCVIDGTVAFCGGIDITKGRTDPTWHDVHCKVSGPIVADLERNFVARWNRAIRSFREFVEKSNKLLPKRVKAGFEIPLRTATALSTTTAGKNTGQATAQMQRTLSESPHLGAPSLKHRKTAMVVATRVGTFCDDVERGYQQAISQARQFIYIENQYFRSLELGSWLQDRVKQVPALNVIVVVPAKPEEKDPVLTPHGNWLQEEAIRNLRRTFYQVGSDGKFGIFSLRTLGAKNPKAMIYVHSKVMIVDDEFAIIGSANANPRSFRLDSEANLVWQDKPSVTAFRRRLWATLLGSPKTMESWKPEEFAKHWRTLADANEAWLKPGKSKNKPATPQGHVIGYPGIMKAQVNALVPEILVDLNSSQPGDERFA
jgi:phosphatidylserine/phosphatidylglycerophosphate/cardiolipin synthase-like enzyme